MEKKIAYISVGCLHSTASTLSKWNIHRNDITKLFQWRIETESHCNFAKRNKTIYLHTAISVQCVFSPFRCVALVSGLAFAHSKCTKNRNTKFNDCIECHVVEKTIQFTGDRNHFPCGVFHCTYFVDSKSLSLHSIHFSLRVLCKPLILFVMHTKILDLSPVFFSYSVSLSPCLFFLFLRVSWNATTFFLHVLCHRAKWHRAFV